MPLRFCIHWARFGPYHLARLRAAAASFAERGAEVVGLETAGDDDLYAWRVEEEVQPFRREQLFPDRVYEGVAPAEMRRATWAALDRIDPDGVAIMSYGQPDARAALTWCRRRRRTAVLMTDTKADDAERVGWRERVKRTIVQQYDAALAAGTPHRAYLEHLGFPVDRVFLGYDVVDNAYFRTRAEAARRHPQRWAHLPGLGDDRPFFLASSRFIERKNFGVLLKAYAAYAAQAAPEARWRLLLLGDGPLRPALEHAIAGHALHAEVELCGFRQIDEIPAYYAAAGAFVHPALTDQWGLVVNEAMASGLPVLVSTGAGCADDLVEDGHTGHRFDPRSADELASVLDAVASAGAETRRAMGAAAEARIEAWSPETFARSLWNAFQAGEARSQRGLSPAAAVVMHGLRWAARRTDSFHTVQR